MKSIVHILTLFGALLLITSCGPARVTTTSSPMFERDIIYDNSWHLVELNGTPITGDRYSYITFTPNSNRMSGYTSCNALGGTVTLSGNNVISLSPVVTTNNNCAGNALDVTLIPSLRGIDRWAMVNDDLVMYRGNSIIARWSPSEYTMDDLDGNWQLAYVSDTELPFNVLYPTDKTPRVVFKADNGILSGTTGYNTISCPMTINGMGVSFSNCTTTNIACEGPGESIFMDNLKSINHYRFVDDNTLVLVTADNKVMRFTRI